MNNAEMMRSDKVSRGMAFARRDRLGSWSKAVGTIAGVAVIAVALGACAPTTVDTPTAVGSDSVAIVTSASPSAAMPSPSPAVTSAPAPRASPTPSVTPKPADEPTSPASAETAVGTAMATALTLAVKGRAAKTGYDRGEFGSGWVDVDRNGCDTRSDMLMLRLTPIDVNGKCKVMSGDLDDPYTGTSVRFVRGGKSEVDIDHIVALSDSWQKGAAAWPFAQRVAFANDPLNLEPVDASANRQKGDGDAATWLPSNKAFRCEYVARQVAVKAKYGVWVTTAELDAITRVLDTCPGEPLPAFGAQPILATNTGGSAPKATPKETKKPAPKKTAKPAPKKTAKPAPKKTEKPAKPKVELDERFPYCKDLPSGYGPYVKGTDPEYEWYRDGDKDGMVCD